MHAYVPPLRRCTTCNKLGHLKAQCRSTVPVCRRCGSRGHTPDVCPNKRCCLNCGCPHSAAYQGCPQQHLRLIANRIRSWTFIPYSEVLKRAHVEVEDRKKPPQPIAETVPHDPSGVRSQQSQEHSNHPNVATRMLSESRIKPVCQLYRRKPPHWPPGP